MTWDPGPQRPGFGTCVLEPGTLDLGLGIWDLVSEPETWDLESEI